MGHPCLPGLVVLALAPSFPLAQSGAPPTFEKIRLTREFHAEGACFADVDRDGHADAVSGPYWYAGPSFERRFAFREPRSFDPLRYSEWFFLFAHDIDRDEWLDLLVIGFPGSEARWFRNPGSEVRQTELWESFLVLDVVENESPAFCDLTGDGVPEIVCNTGGRFGWIGPGPDPRAPWIFHPISDDLGLPTYVHGLGIGDVDGDGRLDLLEKTGWWEQPDALESDPPWAHHPYPFSSFGGAQMFAVDVDGDGRNDVITSKHAHGYGLSWFEQVERSPAQDEPRAERSPAEAGPIDFLEHSILPEEPGSESTAEGVSFSQLHALALADVNGDGLLDILTGKRFWAHGPEGDPEPNAPAVLYWFELRRSSTGVEFIPHRIDDDSGVGVQVSTGDANGDGRVDVVIGNKKGAFVFLQRAAEALRDLSAEEGIRPLGADGRKLNLDFETGDLTDWTAIGEAFAGQPVRGDGVRARGREESHHQGEFWIGGYELHGDGPTGVLLSAPFEVTQPFASFLVGGGGHPQTRVEVVREQAENGAERSSASDKGETERSSASDKGEAQLNPASHEEILFQTSGPNHESLQRVVVDLSGELGSRIRIRLVDEHSSGWGHVNFDDFRFHASRPRFERPAGVPAILPLDSVLHQGLDPGAALAAITLPAGFEAELLAAEPDLHQPIAFTIDARGRIWVAESFSYPERAPEGAGRDTILVLEDRDRDGSFEHRTIFTDELNLVSGIEVGHGGVFVGAAPYLLFFPDRDDDLVPDGPPEILLDGWGYKDTHETLNSFQWGPDGWLYGCHGVFTHSRVGTSGTPDELRTPLNAGVWRYHPTRKDFEVFAWGTSNPWGVDFDANGQAFITACVIPHLWHVVQGGRYQRQSGAHFDAHVYDALSTIADHRHYLGGDPYVGNLRSNSAGGGHAHCGALIYLADGFPSEYRGSIFMHNIHGNRVNRDLLERSGSGFVGRHAADFLLANDKWFRGVALESGPDGSIYLIDWYDEQACHDQRPEAWDRTNGRLYRVSFGRHRAAQVNLAALPEKELVQLQFHQNEWFARRARVLLSERGASDDARALLRRAFIEVAADPKLALRALWALHVCDGLAGPLARTALASPHEYVRAWTIQCLAEDRAVDGEELERFRELARDDPSSVVRLYLACALQRLPLEQRFGLANELVRHGEDAFDPNLPLVVWYGIEPLVTARPDEALALLQASRIEKIRRFLVRRAAAEPELHGRIVALLAAETNRDERAWMLEELAGASRERRDLQPPEGWPALYAELSRDRDVDVRSLALEIALATGDASAYPDLRAIASDRSLEPKRRAQALDALARGKDAGTLALLPELLDEDGARMRLSALRALARFEDASLPELVLSRYASFSEEERRVALGALASRASSAHELLKAAAAGRVPAEDLDAFIRRQLTDLHDPEVDRLLDPFRSPPIEVGEVGALDATAAERIAVLSARLTPDELARADLPRGRDLFARTCMSCHVLFGQGGTLGPDLTGSNRADLEYLLTNAIDPNATVGEDYRSTIVRTLDGRLLTGIEKRRTDTSITLQTRDEEIVVALDDAEEIEPSPLSTMPEALLDSLAFEEVSDLVAYLQSRSQVPRLATQANSTFFFDGATLAGWRGDPAVWSVEEREIVGRTAGLAQNEFLKSELELRDFRLVVEVRLVGDQGNSGIQFRSRELPAGENRGHEIAGAGVAGYQADVGPLWWGKLYEEHGRGLLVDADCEEHVLRDGWNRYEIRSTGHRVQTWLNGQPCVDLEDPEGELGGIVAFQVHSGGPTEVRFRILELEVLEAPAAGESPGR